MSLQEQTRITLPIEFLNLRVLLDADMEMLHKFPVSEFHCLYCGKWRQQIRADEECPVLLRAAMVEVVAREKDRCARICLTEFARWKDADRDSYGIAVGAIGAACNILTAIEGVPALADPPIHPNESTDAELAPKTSA